MNSSIVDCRFDSRDLLAAIAKRLTASAKQYRRVACIRILPLPNLGADPLVEPPAILESNHGLLSEGHASCLEEVTPVAWK
jgi:hypothetical protein